jgi:hypothetical protein
MSGDLPELTKGLCIVRLLLIICVQLGSGRDGISSDTELCRKLGSHRGITSSRSNGRSGSIHLEIY